MGTLTDSKGEFFTKRANEVKDFTIDWASALGSDIISNSTWSVQTGITKDSSTNNNTTATIWLSGGTAGNEYECENTIITAGNATLIEILRVKVIPPPSVSTSALIGLGTFKKLAGLSETSPDNDPLNDFYLNMIEAASAEIIGYCGRNFISGNYTQWVWTDQARSGVVLKEYPVAYIESIHDSLEDAIVLTNNATNAVSARAWVGPDRKLYLQVVGGTSNGLQTIDLTVAANDTLSELVNAVNALSTGWNATLATGSSGYDLCAYLVESTGAPVPTGGLTLQRLGPAIDTSYFYDAANGLLTIQYYGSKYQPALWVRYRGGYDTLPADLQLLTARYALAMQGELGRDPTLESERIGDYSYTRAASSSSVLMALEGQLKNWKSNVV